jgi:predicted nucleic acid-binding protein
MIIFLDACAIIYWVESSEPFYSRFIQKLNELSTLYPEAIIAVSRLSFLECQVKPWREKDEAIEVLYRDFFASPDLLIIELDAQVIDRATRLRADYRLNTADAIQAACALSIPEKVLFMSGDKSFQNILGLQLFQI